MKGLIKDDGVIRQCPGNRVKLGYWRSLWYFHGYKDVLVSFALDEVIKAIRTLLMLILWLALFPALPFLHCLYQHNRAKKEVKIHNDFKGKKE